MTLDDNNEVELLKAGVWRLCVGMCVGKAATTVNNKRTTSDGRTAVFPKSRDFYFKKIFVKRLTLFLPCGILFS